MTEAMSSMPNERLVRKMVEATKVLPCAKAGNLTKMAKQIKIGDTVSIIGSWKTFTVRAITGDGLVLGGTGKSPIVARLDEVERFEIEQFKQDNSTDSERRER